MNYLLDRNDIFELLNIHGLLALKLIYGSEKKTIFSDFIDSKILNKMNGSNNKIINLKNTCLEKINSLPKEFISNYKFYEKCGEIFSEVFDKKLDIDTLSQSIIPDIIDTSQEINAKNFFDKMINNENFAQILNDKIQIKQKNKFLTDMYLKYLKNNSEKFNQIKKEDIFSNLKAIDTSSSLYLSKSKINAYLATSEKNQNLYDLILSDMGLIFESKAELNNYWKSKFKLFSKDTVSIETKESAFFKEESLFLYNLEFKSNFLISKHKASRNEASFFISNFVDCLKEKLEKKYNTPFESSNFSNCIKITAKTQEELNTVKAEVNKIMNHFHILIEDSNLFNSNTEEKIEKINHYLTNIDKYCLFDDLSSNLQSKNSIKKIKI